MSLALDDQICFPLYAASRAMQRRYRPLLDALGLTYTQYLVMLVLWETDGPSVRDLGARLHLDSGTLTPLLVRMDKAGLVRRTRSCEDARVVHVHLTEHGAALRAQASDVPGQLVSCLQPPEDLDLGQLKASLERLLHTLQETP